VADLLKIGNIIMMAHILLDAFIIDMVPDVNS